MCVLASIAHSRRIEGTSDTPDVAGEQALTPCGSSVEYIVKAESRLCRCARGYDSVNLVHCEEFRIVLL
jgi:hypothetical protein